jgi:chorismate lyase/3-hydroxybenzoate synthase
VENPHQVPAWKYPADHGPKAPSFVRATRADACGHRWCWVSGTASIRGHESVAPGDLATQLKVTLENLNVVLGSLGLPLMGVAPSGGTRVLTKVYLRDGGKLDEVWEGLGAAAAGALFVEAAICRAELELEIEVSVVTDCLFPAPASR